MTASSATYNGEVLTQVKSLHYSKGAEPIGSLDDISVEHSVDVFIDGVLALHIVCTPSHLHDLVLGRLFTEGVIKGLDGVDGITVSPECAEVHVELSLDAEAQTGDVVESVPTTGSGNKVYSNLFAAAEALVPLKSAAWDPEDIYALATRFIEDAPLHKATFGSHSCYLARGREILYCREDLGRHNAFDKVVGAALRDGVDLGECTVFTSGRIPVDMVTKAIRAKVPVLASKAVPTDVTIALAQKYNLTLICSARKDSFKVYSDPAQAQRRL